MCLFLVLSTECTAFSISIFAKGNGGEWRYVPAMGLEMRKSSSECCKGHCDEECQAEFVKHDPWIEYKGAIVTSDGVDTRDSLGEE